MACFLSYFSVWMAWLGGVVTALVLGCAVVYVWATRAPLETRLNDPGA